MKGRVFRQQPLKSLFMTEVKRIVESMV